MANMLTVSIELHPASGGRPRVLSVLCIANDETGTVERGNYRVWWDTQTPAGMKPDGFVKDWPRERSAALLVAKALEVLS